MVSKDTMTKYLYIYARILMLVAVITFFMAAYIVLGDDTPDCYTEYDDSTGVYSGDQQRQYSNINSEDCIFVENIEEIEAKYNRYKYVGAFSILGYLIVQPGYKYQNIQSKLKKLCR